MGANRRRELADFLRSRRARVMPADVGLPTSLRRRAAGLRREEVAVLAGLSPSWYTYLEQGRDINPSAEVLDSLARVLGLTEDERRYLHTLAYGGVTTPRPLVDELAAAEIARQLVATAAESPYPVYAINYYCDLIAWNRATASYYADFGQLPVQRRNMLRMRPRHASASRTGARTLATSWPAGARRPPAITVTTACAIWSASSGSSAQSSAAGGIATTCRRTAAACGGSGIRSMVSRPCG